MKRLFPLVLFVVIAFAACSNTGMSQGGETTTAPESPAAETTTTVAPGASSPITAAELGELFRQAHNSGDVAAVAALAPTFANQDLQDVIGVGPFETVNCVTLEGQDVCSISNADTPYDFVLDLSTGQVTEIFYTGGA